MRHNGLGFLACILAMPLCVTMLPGISAEPLTAAVLAGTVLGLAYLLLRPILKLLTFPIGCLSLGFSGFIIDCCLILMLGKFIPGFQVEGLEWAALAALLTDGICLVAGGIR